MSENNLQTTDVTNSGAAPIDEVQEPEKKKKKVRRTFEKQFSEVRNIIELSIKDETLKGIAAEYGYPAGRIAGLKSMFDETDGHYEDQKTALAKQRAATRDFVEKKEKATKTTRHIVDTAKLAFKNDPDMYDELGLNDRREKAFGPWAAQNKYFYGKILVPENVAVMAEFKVTQAELETGQQEVLDTITAETEGENSKAEKQKATELKYKSWNKLKKAVRKYINVMKEALEDDPQMKEKLGIVTPITA